MKPYSIFFLIFLSSFFFFFCYGNLNNDQICSERIDENGDRIEECYDKIFKPTNEFQEIKEGQQLPKGLHIRMNFETGKKEAKLNEPDNKVVNRELTIVDSNERNDIEDNETLKAKFKEMKRNKKKKDTCFEDPIESNGGCSKRNDEEKAKQLTEDHNSVIQHIDVVKDDEEKFGNKNDHLKPLTKERIEELNEIWEVLLEAADEEPKRLREGIKVLLNNSKTTEEIEKVLDDIEPLVHFYDYGRDLVALGGVPPIISLLNSPLLDLRFKAATVLGNALQSNIGVQIYCFEQNLLDTLTHHISKEQDSQLKKKLLFTLSCLVRNYPDASETFLRNGILNQLSNLVLNSMDLGFKKKSVGLIIDLVREELDKLEGKEFEEAKQALIGSVFDAQISQGNWCHHFIDLALQEGDFNSIENGLNALQMTSSICKKFPRWHSDLPRVEAILKKNNDEELNEFVEELNSLWQNVNSL